MGLSQRSFEEYIAHSKILVLQGINEEEGEEGEEGGEEGTWLSPLLQMGLLLMIFRKAVRAPNFPLLHATRLALFPLWLTESHPKYRHGMAFFLRDLLTIPPKLRAHIEKIMVSTSTGRENSSQGLDFLGEELNKFILRGVTPNPAFSVWKESVRLEPLITALRQSFEKAANLKPIYYYSRPSTNSGNHISDLANWQASIRLSGIFASPQTLAGDSLDFPNALDDAKKTSSSFLSSYSSTHHPNHPKIPRHGFLKLPKKKKTEEEDKEESKKEEEEEEKKKKEEEKKKQQEKKKERRREKKKKRKKKEEEEKKRKEEERKKKEEEEKEERRRREKKKRLKNEEKKEQEERKKRKEMKRKSRRNLDQPEKGEKGKKVKRKLKRLGQEKVQDQELKSTEWTCDWGSERDNKLFEE